MFISRPRHAVLAALSLGMIVAVTAGCGSSGTGGNSPLSSAAENPSTSSSEPAADSFNSASPNSAAGTVSTAQAAPTGASSSAEEPNAAGSGTPTTVTPPPAIASAGEMVVAISSSPPYDVLDTATNTWTGIDVDLIDAAAQLMGVKAKYVTAQFDAEIPGLASGRFDLAPNIGDFIERRSSATFIDYAQSHLAIEVRAPGGFQPETLLDLCGHTIGYENGTATKAASDTLLQQCPAAGKKASAWQAFPNRSALELALRSERIEGLAAPVASNDASAAASNGELKNLAVEGLDAIPGLSAIYGFAVAKDSPLAQAMLEALQTLTADGTYQSTFDKYNLPGGALDPADIKINGSTLHKK